MKFCALEFWKLRLGILIMKFEVWTLSKTEALSLKLGRWEYEIENIGMKIFELKIWILKDPWKFWNFLFFYFFRVDSAFAELKSVGAEILASHFIISLFLLFSFMFHQLLFLHWHHSPSSSPWFFFFISPFFLTKNTFLSFSTLPYPSLSIFL